MLSIEEEMKKYEELTGYFCQNCFLDRCAEKYDDLVCLDYADVAIVIQGPIHYDDDFTLETVKLYKKWYPNAKVIVSTWKDARQEVVTKIKECGAIVVLGDEPSESGIFNVNFQILSTINGINKAREIGAEYVLKTRTNQRLTMDNFMETLMHFLEIYATDFPEYQKGRIIVPFIVPHIIGYVCDFLAFGYIDDIANYFDAQLQQLTESLIKSNDESTAIIDHCFRQYTLQKIYNNVAVLDSDSTYANLNNNCIFPEVYLGKNYMQNTLKLSPTLTNYMKFIGGGLVCADMRMLGLYWRKETYGNIGRYNKGLVSTYRFEAMYGDWLWLFRRISF